MNTYLSNHKTVFYSLIGILALVPSLLFCISLVHTVRGSKNTFTLWMNVAGIIVPVFYLIHVWFLNRYGPGNIWGALFYYMSGVSLLAQHWILAHTHYSTSTNVPYILQRKEVPESL